MANLNWSAISAVLTALGLLGAVIGWIGKMLWDKLDHIHDCIHRVEDIVDEHIQFHLNHPK